MSRFKRLLENSSGSPLLIQALTHSSYLHENPGCNGSYERLEFLGDSVLGMLCAELLSERCPALNEGQLSRLRSIFVSEPSLAARANRLNVAQYIRLGRGELANGGLLREALLADVLEAIIAAVYRSEGLETARSLLREEIFPEWSASPTEWARLLEIHLQKDGKSQLQEWIQQKGMGLPRYVCMNSEAAGSVGPFEMAVFVDDIELKRITAGSKKEATLELATSLLAMGQEKLVVWLQNLGLKVTANSAVAKTHDLGVDAKL